jgi:TrmH family RNA methyltransferase
MSRDNIRIVLVRPTHPGNIGACARAMKNMGLARLVLIAPAAFPHPEARERAAGAVDVVERIEVYASLEEALAGCRLVIGTSARPRRIEWPALDPREAARRLVEAAARAPAALLFGPERTGLTNEDLDRCHYAVTIPTDPAYPSLNLAAAVQILAYEIFRVGEPPAPPPAGPEPADHAYLQAFYRHLEQVMLQAGFLDPENPRLTMRRLVRLFNRAQPDRDELDILRGLLTAVQQRLRQP